MELTMSQRSVAEITPVPADVLAYAAKHGVEGCLRPLLEMTQDLFPCAARLEVFLEEDPEIADLKFIVFLVGFVGTNADQVYEAREQWIRESPKSCPPPCPFPFALALELAR
jgi:hypothetical protein